MKDTNVKFNDISTDCLTKMKKQTRYKNEISFASFAIKEGEHFNLPLNGICLFDVNTLDVHESYLNYLQMPFPITILQFCAEDETVVNVDSNGHLTEKETNNTDDKKVIIYVVSLKLLLNKKYIKLKETKANVQNHISLSSILEDPNEWLLLSQHVSGFIPLDGLLIRTKDFYIKYNEEDNNKTFFIDHVNMIHVILNENTSTFINGSDNWVYASRSSLSSCFTTLIDFCLTINCRNVKIKNNVPSNNVNKIRRASGKPPYSEFKTLTIKDEPIGYYTNEEKRTTEKGSVKFHKRRGHLRHYKNGTILFIESTYVGRKEKGTIVKVYKIE